MKTLKVLVGCECSGVVRREFQLLGHEAYSCDLKPADDRSKNHIQCDVRKILGDGWDMGIFFPDCTHLTVSGAWAFKDPNYERYPGTGYHQKVKPGTLTGKARRAAREDALAFVRLLWESVIQCIAIENPVGNLCTMFRRPTQKIQPYEFGDDASKLTCLWLKGLPRLTPTKYVHPRMVDGKPRWANQTDGGQNRLSPSAGRSAERAVTYLGVAKAMASQWG